MAVIILVYQNRPLSDWPYQRITLNAVISVMSILFKGGLLFVVTQALSQAKWLLYSSTKEGDHSSRTNAPSPLIYLQIFDDASRGPWGSIRLLFKSPKAWYGVWGSIIIFLATALHPFAQQLVSYPDVRQDNMVIASVGKSFRYKGNDTAFYLPDGRLYSNSLGMLLQKKLGQKLFLANTLPCQETYPTATYSRPLIPVSLAIQRK